MTNQENWTEDEDLGSYDGISDGPPPPLEPGIYSLKVVKATPGLTKNSKDGKPKPKADLELKVLRRYGSDETIGRKTFATLVFSQEAKFRLLNVSKCFGIEPPSRTGQEAVSAFCTELLQAGESWAKLSQETNNKGKTVSKIDYFMREEQIESALGNSTEQPAEPVAHHRHAR